VLSYFTKTLTYFFTSSNMLFMDKVFWIDLWLSSKLWILMLKFYRSWHNRSYFILISKISLYFYYKSPCIIFILNSKRFYLIWESNKLILNIKGFSKLYHNRILKNSRKLFINDLIPLRLQEYKKKIAKISKHLSWECIKS
jgi:hypothetical protein